MDQDGDPEVDPLRALAAGDPRPFEAFVRTRSRSLVGFFLRLGAGLPEAEDLTQDVLVRLYRHASQYRPRERFLAFCFRTARNAWIDRCRRAGVRPSPAVGEGDAGTGVEERGVPRLRPHAADDPLARAEDAELVERMGRALAQLPAAHRVVVELAVFEDLAYGEVAAALGIPVGTVKSRMHHAVRKLRSILGEEP